MRLFAATLGTFTLTLTLLAGGAHAQASNGASAAATEAVLRVEGLTDVALLTNVRNTVPPPRLACDAPHVQFLSYLRKASDSAAVALRALGHFNATIESRVEPGNADSPGDTCPTPLLIIEAGPPVLIEQVDITIDGPFESDPSAVRFFTELRLKPGDRLDQGLYDSTRDDLINRARARGYLDAHYARRTLWVDREQNTARIELTLDTGARYRFGEISSDQDILEPRFMSRLIPAQPGDAYSSDRLAAISSNLAASGYFADVRVRPNLDQRDDETVPVSVLLTPRKRTAYEFRAGFATDTGVRLRADVDRRWVNRRGHTWRAGLGLSQHIQTLDTVYSIPQRDPLTDSLDFFARVTREDNNDIVSDAGTLGAQLSRLRGGWTQALFTEYRFERSKFGGEPEQSSHFLLSGVRIGQRVLDDPLFPLRGHSFNLSLQAAAEPLASSTSLVQASVRGVVSRPFGRTILKGRGEIGSTWVDDFSLLPKSLRFFAGGDNSVRGYGFETLGPENDDGEVIGGRHLVILSAEAMMPMYGDDWFGAVFVDSGNAFDTFSDMNLKTGAGAGVRWRSPIGMVRVDIAVPFNASSRSPRLHLGIGAEF